MSGTSFVRCGGIVSSSVLPALPWLRFSAVAPPGLFCGEQAGFRAPPSIERNSVKSPLTAVPTGWRVGGPSTFSLFPDDPMARPLFGSSLKLTMPPQQNQHRTQPKTLKQMEPPWVEPPRGMFLVSGSFGFVLLRRLRRRRFPVVSFSVRRLVLGTSAGNPAAGQPGVFLISGASRRHPRVLYSCNA